MLNEQEGVGPGDEVKRATLFTSLPTLSCVYSQQACIWNSILCISKYAYDVNITLHLLLLNTFRVCSFITLSVVIKQNELNRLSLPFVSLTECCVLSEESVSSRGFNVFIFAW